MLRVAFVLRSTEVHPVCLPICFPHVVSTHKLYCVGVVAGVVAGIVAGVVALSVAAV